MHLRIVKPAQSRVIELFDEPETEEEEELQPTPPAA